MVNSLLEADRPRSVSPVTGSERGRTPFYLESQGQWLFAWLHQPGPTSLANHGVILCPPVGHEQVHSHRSLRHLADAFVQAGFPVLRFDYHGTGDSGGTVGDPDRYATWLANVRDAHTWMRRHLPCARISLVGLRLGAALAAEVAAQLPVDGVVLWAPVVKGRAFIRELKVLGLPPSDRGVPAADPPPDVEAAGFLFTSQTLCDLGRLDLLQVRPQCRRALVVARDDVPEDFRLRDHLKFLGCAVEQIVCPGYADMMAEPHNTRVPTQGIAALVRWLRTGEDTEQGGESGSYAVRTATSYPQSARHSSAAQSPVHERALYLGSEPRLFGVVSAPCSQPDQQLPFVVLLNAGSAYRVGPNRLNVMLARQLAVQGFRCLRLDLSGLGDSDVFGPTRENDPYPATAFRDIDHTLNYLQTQMGAQRVVLAGLCSGAYAAFQAAAQLKNPLLVESILINPLTFFWKEGMSLDASPATHLLSFHDCMVSLWQPSKWRKLLTGRSKLGVLGALRMLADHWMFRRQAGQPAPSVDTTPADGFPSHPTREDLPGDLERIVRADRRLTFFFSRSDPGYRLLLLRARAKVRALQRAGKIRLSFIDDADHTFTRHSRRTALCQMIADHLCRRYAPVDEP